MAGGGGGDGGYEARQQKIEAQKAQARAKLNQQFGYGGGMVAPVNPFSGKRGWLGALVDTAGAEATATDFQRQQAEYEAAQNAENPNRAARDRLYDTVRTSAFDSGKRRLDEGMEDAARQNKFELFARGLSGGSEDIDQNAKLNRTYTQGVMDLGAKADAARAQFRGDDENTRLQLLQSIDAGMDEGSALSSAAQRMQVAADRASADAQGTALGNVFDTAGLLYQQSQASKGRQAATEWWNEMKPGGGRGSAGSKTGVSTRLPGE
jgi:hypothetical protein